jgi:hypothetical protein
MLASVQKQRSAQKGMSTDRMNTCTSRSRARSETTDILRLQRTIGNQALARLIGTAADKREVGASKAAFPRAAHDITPPAVRLMRRAVSRSDERVGSAGPGRVKASTQPGSRQTNIGRSHLTVAPFGVQRDDHNESSRTPPTREEAERTARRFHRILATARSVDAFRTAVESAAASALDAIGADALVFSISGAAGYWAGAGGGFEAVYSPRFGWATYFQVGGGFSTPGASAAFEVGVIWNLHNPRDYRGSFIELAGSYGHFSGSAFISPSSSPSGGIKVGGSIGPPGVSLFYEYYWQLSGITALPDIVHRGHYTFFLSPMLLCGRREQFVVQFNTENTQTRQIRIKVLHQRVNQREEATFNLSTGETLNPVLLDEEEYSAIFDLTRNNISDLRVVIPSYVLSRTGGGLNIEIMFRGNVLRRISYPGIPAGTLSTGRQYFRISGTDYLPSGPRYVDECGMAVNDRDR